MAEGGHGGRRQRQQECVREPLRWGEAGHRGEARGPGQGCGFDHKPKRRVVFFKVGFTSGLNSQP